MLLLLTAIRQARNPDVTLEQLKKFCGVWRSTIKRWQHYFRELFPHTINYRRLSGRLMPPIAADQWPRALLAYFYQMYCDSETALIACLQKLAMGP